MTEKTAADSDKNTNLNPAEEKKTLWLDVKDGRHFGVYGTDALDEPGFCRLKKSDRDYIRTVSEGEAWLAEQSSGIQVRFVTDSSQLAIKGRNRSPFDMTNITPIGECGADLYVYDEEMRDYVLHEVVRCPLNETSYEFSVGHFTDKPRKKRKYILYLALYMAVEELYIGVDGDAFVRPYGFLSDIKIGVYGTSIVQGCSASRPGMSPVNYLSRKMDAEVFNYGFSGVAMMEKELGRIISAKDLNLLIVDAEPNAGVDRRMEENAEGFLDAFFEKKPKVPVILFGRVLFALDRYDGFRVKLREYYADYLSSLAASYRKKGHPVFFADGARIFKGNYTEYTADGVHPNDIGMVALASAYRREAEKVLRRLKKSE